MKATMDGDLRANAGRLGIVLDNAAPYLISRQLLATKDVVHPKFEIKDYSRRNRNFKVIVPGGGGWLLKQPSDLQDADARSTVTAEATFLETVARDEALAEL